MIKQKEDITKLLLANKDTLRAFGASRIGLFGSYKEQANNAASDIDLLVEFEEGKKNFKNYTGTYLFLKELFQKEIDFLTHESLSPYIGPHILKSIEYVSLDS
jgi:predicted nucleotidyltransferase